MITDSWLKANKDGLWGQGKGPLEEYTSFVLPRAQREGGVVSWDASLIEHLDSSVLHSCAFDCHQKGVLVGCRWLISFI